MPRKEKNPEKELEGLFNDFKYKEDNPKKSPVITQLRESLPIDPIKATKEVKNIAEPHIISDLERNNMILEENNSIIREKNEWEKCKDKWNIFFKLVFIFAIVLLVYYSIENNVFNNLVYAFFGCD